MHGTVIICIIIIVVLLIDAWLLWDTQFALAIVNLIIALLFILSIYRMFQQSCYPY